MMSDFYIFLPLMAFLIPIGALAGVIAGMLGVGGGIILVPAFYYLFSSFGYGGPHLMQICLATSLATIIVTSVRSVLAHHRRGAVEWCILRQWGVFIGFGALCGALVMNMLRTPQLQAIFGVVGCCVGLYMAFGRQSWQLAPEMPKRIFIRFGIGGGMGFFSVLMGIAGGSFGVPLMTLHGVSIHRAVATSAGLGVVSALPSVSLFMLTSVENAPPYMLGAVNFPAFALIVGMTMLTTPLGVRLAHAIDPKLLRRLFALFISLVALSMLRKSLGY